jgi:two-component system chemotaxis sensor kinase CheA
VRLIQRDLDVLRGVLERLAAARTTINDLFEAVHQLDRVTEGIQRTVMDTRMVPIGPLFGRFRRVVRDITRSNGKDIRLEIHGEKTELDKRMIDELGDPLIHMVRNSADHGVEQPETRVAAGKPAQGVITLNAFHRGNRIVIQVIDDGKGLDADRIRKKALERELVTPADLERMTLHQVYNLIWEPGFSTAEKVTEISGRGMGMDIVKSKIEELNGTVEVDSVPGQGATLTIKLPLTMAILPSLMAEVGGGVFALPIESVVEIVRISADKVNTVQGVPTATVRGRVISIVQLDELFTWNDGEVDVPATPSTDVTMVILGSEGRELGLRVDLLLGEEDIVIKSLADNFRHVPGIAGASILGDGRVALILDIAGLVDAASRRGGLSNAAKEIAV